MRVEASVWTARKLWTDKRGQILMRHPDVQAEILSVAHDAAASIAGKIGSHSKTGRLESSVDVVKGRGRSKYRYYIIIGKGIPYALAFEHGRKTNGAYEGFHVIEGEMEW